MRRPKALLLGGECPDARLCPHVPTPPPANWPAQRELQAKRAIQNAYSDYPDHHKRAIFRARQERPQYREEMRQLLWARRWLRRRP